MRSLAGAVRQVASVCGLLLSVAFAGQALAQDAGEPTVAVAAPAPVDHRPAQIRALIAGTLDVAVVPQALFEVPLTDEGAVQVEAVRVRAFLRAIEEASRPPPPPPPADPRKRRPTPPAEAPDAGPFLGELAAVDAERWSARLALDRARLEFYELPRERRDALLQAHADRQEAAKPRETEEARRAREAELERQRALEAARIARTESERVLAEELARLIGLETQVAAVRAEFATGREQLATRKDTLLGWQRRVRDAVAAGPQEVDATYDSLRRTLRAGRTDLEKALDALAAGGTSVPAIGPDALAEVPADIPTDEARERRAAVERAIAEATADEAAFRSERAAALLDEVSALNRERLGLVPLLSSDKRGAVTGFSAAGWDQAVAETFHLSLILRYHRQIAQEWIASIPRGGPSGFSPWRVAAVVVPWVFFTVAFLLGRRRMPRLLAMADHRLAEDDRAERLTSPSFQRRALRFLAKIHRPIEWGLYFAVSMWLLPDSAQGLLEVQLLTSVIGWVLGGALVVNGINAFAAGTVQHIVLDEGATGELRLRSLRLVGRTVVAFALILVLSDRLVGAGTIYSWVFSTCWFAALPVFLFLVRWWRGVVFERMERTRGRSAWQEWVLANRSGWKSFLAAMLGAVLLFTFGVVKVARNWLSRFDLARRIHAYFFRRGLERLGEANESHQLTALKPEALEVLHPERPYTNWLSCPAEEVLEAISTRLSEGRGGVVALIGARGMGKTSLLRALQAREPRSVATTCDAGTSVEQVHELYSGQTPPPRMIILDHAHALVRPVIGGLAHFDELIAAARANCQATTWVFAIDSAVWPFLKRARDARPLFDETHELEPWSEEQIGALLADRCQQAGLSPSYDDLLEKLPASADEYDRAEAVRARQAGYERMLWDHVHGNPALALEVWRASLGEDEKGSVRVRPLQVPETETLDALPDSSLFILRAVLQLAPAGVEDVARATRLSAEQVLNAVRFGQSQGFFERSGDRVRVTWAFLRPVVRLLERRHLLVGS